MEMHTGGGGRKWVYIVRIRAGDRGGTPIGDPDKALRIGGAHKKRARLIRGEARSVVGSGYRSRDGDSALDYLKHPGGAGNIKKRARNVESQPQASRIHVGDRGDGRDQFIRGHLSDGEIVIIREVEIAI